MKRNAYRVHGMAQSYFTRKMTGYFDYKEIPCLFRRFPGASPEAMAAGWPGGVPVVETPEGEFMWDTTAMIHHLELRFPARAVLPPEPLTRFLCYLLEDLSDEWLYRPAVGTRWHFEANGAVAGFELARDMTVKMPIPCAVAHAAVRAHVTSTLPALGVTGETIQAWVDEVLRPWTRALQAHLEGRPYLFGGRPSLADFALFGGNAAHFVNDPLCRAWADEDGPAVVQHTHRLLEPEEQSCGEWSDEVPASLLALLRDAGRLYLPWVSRACTEGTAEIAFASGPRVQVGATDFLREARATLLARYLECRSPRLDEVLEQAGIRQYFADFAAGAGSISDYDQPPQPALNRPFAPPEA